MPDANGKFKGIVVPELPWRKVDAPVRTLEEKRADAYDFRGRHCINPNCQFCDAAKELERPRS